MTLSIIVAVSENGVIGRQGGLPWHLPGDLKWFKAKTVGHTLIMGRKTYESVGRPLPGRTTVVITRDPLFVPDGVAIARSVDEAIGKAPGDDEVFIGGGGEVFRQILPAVHRMYITRVHAHIDGDTYFPEVDWSRWRETFREDHPADEKNAYPYSFVIYERAN
jgi:dihydrofolate reductase